MKPTDIFEAIADIPDSYIEAAKPADRQHGESRRPAQQTVRSTETVIPPDAQSRQGRKDKIRMSSKQSVLQRAATACAAAAACAVFVGGGFFIAQQAKQNRQQTSESSGQGIQNFLGGTGEIHVASDFSRHLMYDDSKVYLWNGQLEAKRSGNSFEAMQQRESADDIFWDGEQFYRAEDQALYRIDMTGSHMDETPFYTISADKMQSGTENLDTSFFEVRKLADGYYYVSFSVMDTADPQSHAYACVYQPATGQEESLPNDSVGIWPLLTDGTDYVAVSYNGSILYRIALDPVNIKTLRTTGSGISNYVTMMLSDGSLYFVKDTDLTESDQISYCKFDLKTRESSEIQQDCKFQNFVPFDGKIYYYASELLQLRCADPDMMHTETIYDLNEALTQEQLGTLSSAAYDAATSALIAADDSYFLIAFANIDSPEDYDPYEDLDFILIDRQTGKAQIIRNQSEPDVTEPDDAEPNVTETDPVANVLGGSGEIHAAGDNWNRMFYDDDYVYVDSDSGLLRGERNPAVRESPNELTRIKQPALICDNKNLYMANGFSLYRLGSRGKPEAEPFFTVSDADIADFEKDFQCKAYPANYNVQRLDDQYYLVFFTLCDAADTENVNNIRDDRLNSRDIAYLYNFKTGACTEFPDSVIEVAPFRVIGSSDGKNNYFHSTRDGFWSIKPEPFRVELFEVPQEYPIRIYGDTNCCIRDQNVYYLTRGEKFDSLYPKYCRYNTETKECTVLQEKSVFSDFIGYDGMIYTCDFDGKQIYCTDPELNEKTVLIDFETDIPADLRSAVWKTYDPSQPFCPFWGVNHVDENLLSTRLRDGTIVLLDRRSGALSFYRDPEAVKEAQQQT